MRYYLGHITGKYVVVGGSSDLHGRWTAPNQVMFGTMKYGVQEKKWAIGVEIDIRSFNIQQHWKYAVQDDQSWTQIVIEGRQRLMTERTKEGEGKAKRRQNNRTSK